MSGKAVITLSKDDEYETPQDLFDDACNKYDIFPTLDVCASLDNRKCAYCFDKETNGLKQEWKFDFFMNPPYSEVAKWVEQAYEMHEKYNVNGLALIFSKTDTKWWHKYIEGKAEVHFIEGRVKFWKNNKPTKYRAPYANCWVIWRSKK